MKVIHHYNTVVPWHSQTENKDKIESCVQPTRILHHVVKIWGPKPSEYLYPPKKCRRPGIRLLKEFGAWLAFFKGITQHRLRHLPINP